VLPGGHQGLGVLEGAPPRPLPPEAGQVGAVLGEAGDGGRLPVQHEKAPSGKGQPHGEEELPGLHPVGPRGEEELPLGGEAVEELGAVLKDRHPDPALPVRGHRQGRGGEVAGGGADAGEHPGWGALEAQEAHRALLGLHGHQEVVGLGQALLLLPGALQEGDDLLQRGPFGGVFLQHPEDQVGKALGDLRAELLGGGGHLEDLLVDHRLVPPAEGGWPVRAS
jgi:hypothetical protein